MTTEDDFQAVLDANPDDWQTRLVFADWLQERDDPRSEGYRALGANQCIPDLTAEGDWMWSMYGSLYCLPHHDYSCWWDQFARRFVPRESGYGVVLNCYRWCARREAEDDAALAFAKLPPERRAELLAAQPVA